MGELAAAEAAFVAAFYRSQRLAQGEIAVGRLRAQGRWRVAKSYLPERHQRVLTTIGLQVRNSPRVGNPKVLIAGCGCGFSLGPRSITRVAGQASTPGHRAQQLLAEALLPYLFGIEHPWPSGTFSEFYDKTPIVELAALQLPPESVAAARKVAGLELLVVSAGAVDAFIKEKKDVEFTGDAKDELFVLEQQQRWLRQAIADSAGWASAGSQSVEKKVCFRELTSTLIKHCNTVWETESVADHQLEAHHEGLKSELIELEERIIAIHADPNSAASTNYRWEGGVLQALKFHGEELEFDGNVEARAGEEHAGLSRQTAVAMLTRQVEVNTINRVRNLAQHVVQKKLSFTPSDDRSRTVLYLFGRGNGDHLAVPLFSAAELAAAAPQPQPQP